MPRLIIETNADITQAAADELLSTLTDMLAAILEKPKQKFAIILRPNKFMMMGGSSDKCAQCSLHSIGKVDLEHNTAVSQAVASTLKKVLGVADDRYYLFFTDCEKENVGTRGATAANLPSSN